MYGYRVAKPLPWCASEHLLREMNLSARALLSRVHWLHSIS